MQASPLKRIRLQLPPTAPSTPAHAYYKPPTTLGPLVMVSAASAILLGGFYLLENTRIFSGKFSDRTKQSGRRFSISSTINSKDENDFVIMPSGPLSNSSSIQSFQTATPPLQNVVSHEYATHLYNATHTNLNLLRIAPNAASSQEVSSLTRLVLEAREKRLVTRNGVVVTVTKLQLPKTNVLYHTK